MALKKKFTGYLLIAAIALLLSNVIIDLIKKPEKHEIVNELTVRQIDSVFNFVLKEYGIDSAWISTKKLKIADEDSINKQYVVMLPSDLPIPLIIRDINKIIEKDITGFVSEEKKIFGTTEIRIYTNEILKLQASLIADPNTVRQRNNFAFIISDAFELGETDYNKFLYLPYTLSVAVVPGETVPVKADTLNKFSKEYIALINNEISGDKFKLEPGDQKALLKRSVDMIVKSLNKSQLFVVDEQSKIFNSTVYNFVRDEFKKKGKKLVHLSEFIKLGAGDETELISKFKFHCEGINEAKQKIFYLPYEDFLTIRAEVEKARKRGSRVIPLSSTVLVKNIKQQK
ncbi:MAG: hypothetical protein HYS25_02965 [Ignavibacteriales bacterium]|nr:hypothetical protein [Ignavibacteriales bacterium]